MEYTTGTVVFNDWIITREIGQGAAGKVCEIKKTAYGEEDIRSALKIISIPRTPSDIKAVMSEGMSEKDITCYYKEFVDEILQEIKIMVSLKEHPNIVTYEDHCIIPHPESIGWDILIKMELLIPLQEWQIEHPLQEEDIVRLGCEISSALAFAADKGLVHRDVKPGNIFVNSFGQFKLGDFGIARTIEKTMGGLSKKGTESYMAPEVYLGKKYNAQVDIYSLGIVLYRFLNNSRLPFYPPAPERISYSDRENALVKRIQGTPVPEPLNGSPQLKRIVLKACEYMPEKRYASMKEMHQALLELQDDERTVIETQSEKIDRHKTKKTRKIIAGAGISAMIVLGAMLFILNNRPTEALIKQTDTESETEAVTESEQATTEAVAETESESAETEAVTESEQATTEAATETESESAETEAVTESEQATTEAATETESEQAATESEKATAYAEVSAENDLSRYLGSTTDEVKEKFGMPNSQEWPEGETQLLYDDYYFKSRYSLNNQDIVCEIMLQTHNDDTEYFLCGVTPKMSEEEAVEQLQKQGFYKLPTGIFYDGVKQLIKLEADKDYVVTSDKKVEAKETGTLKITALQLRDSLHPEKKEVFQYMGGTLKQVLQDIGGLKVFPGKEDVMAINDEIVVDARLNGEDIDQAVVSSITVVGEDSPYCLYGMTVEDIDKVDDYLPFEKMAGSWFDDFAGNYFCKSIWQSEDSVMLVSDPTT